MLEPGGPPVPSIAWELAFLSFLILPATFLKGVPERETGVDESLKPSLFCLGVTSAPLPGEEKSPS